jgi:hypothetical protein
MRCGLRHQRGGRYRKVREGKGTKEREIVDGKAAGDECVFIPGEGPGWQMRSGLTPYRTRRAVRAVMGPLDWMAVIHRYLLNRL